ncbi:phosphotransferase family protein [Paenibacillus alkalitolerans]|uniref:phosphotransferase family protein n=1 Tax=Paenibacillus alkalitolerans TaxID=2799335 RepID=UPI0018F78648|nr:phosphotransferase [Paenibacillus alkalitolerans]
MLEFFKSAKLAPKLFQSLEFEQHTALQMEHISGVPFLDTVLEHYRTPSFEMIYPLFASLGESLAQLHSIQIENFPSLPLIVVSNPPKKEFIDADIYSRSHKLISLLNEINDRHQVLLHGDFGYHNVIRDITGGNKIIDWELAGIGDPRVDIANVLFWSHLHFPEIASDCVKVFIDSYKNHKAVDCSSEILQSFIIFQVWRIVEMVTDKFPDHVKREWNRRLSWALDHKFI